MDRVDIKIGFKCNNFCQFCVQGEKRNKFENRTLEQIKKALAEAKEQGTEGVVFTGGEPTIHPDILAVVKYARDLGFKNIQIQSNGRMFAYLDFCKKLVLAGANEFSPALHGSKPEIHDELTNSPGAWQQVVQGIKNLKFLGQYVLTNTVINSKNYKDLPNLAQLLVNLGVDQFQFAFVHILGTAAKNKDWLVPKMSEVMPFVKKGLDIGIVAGKRVMTEAIPYCLMQGYEDYIAEKIMPETKIVDAEGVIENFSEYRLNKGKVKREECKICKYFKICEGPWKEYPEIFGWDEFMPVIMQQADFVKLADYDQELCRQISDLYDLGKIISVFKYQGHTCNQVHLFEFENKKVIVKLTKYKEGKILLEKELLDKFQDLNFPKLLINKISQPFFEYKGNLIKVYEFIEGKKINLENNLDIVTEFINKMGENDWSNFYNADDVYKKTKAEFEKANELAREDELFNGFVDFCADNRQILNEYFQNREKIIPYHNLDVIRGFGRDYILETEHLTENFYPFIYAIANYFVDILDKANDKNIEKTKVNNILNSILTKINFEIDKNKIKLIKILILSILLNRIFDKSNNPEQKGQNKYLNLYKTIAYVYI
ncbi:MAG: radical SAM protein [Candidatus Parcubacteria bacterium]|nr:radical SAM protein [Candidatus Parcubacteria bacterium]